jgi:hypothetical protein
MASPQRGHTRAAGDPSVGEVAGAIMPLRYTRSMPEWSDHQFLKTVFDETRVLRTPLRGIISGYHVLPYVLVGPSAYEDAGKAVEVRGRIRVSPRLILGGAPPTYGELFGEHELMDGRIEARLFSFRSASRVSLESEDLRIRRYEREVPAQLDRVLEELSQREIIDTAVIASPDARFYPVSLDRFIREILDQEFPGGRGGE